MMQNKHEQHIKASSMCIDDNDSDQAEPFQMHMRTDNSPVLKSGESLEHNAAVILPR
jgi:hypothetical protein